MKKYSGAPIIILLAMVLAFVSPFALYADDAQGDAGREWFRYCKDGLYYLELRSEGDITSAYAGMLPHDATAKALEKKIPVPVGNSSIRKMWASQGVMYILGSFGGAGSVNENSLLAFNLVSGDSVSRDHVLDVEIVNEAPLIIDASGQALRVTYQEKILTLSLQGAGTFKHIVDNRLVFVSSGPETEIVDILSGVSLYQYSSVFEYAIPVSYNLIIEALDSPDAIDSGIEKQIFYKIIINGEESARTETGSQTSLKKHSLMAPVSEKLTLRLERWELDPGKDRYERVNNIHQPRYIQLDVPLNRIMRVRLEFNGATFDVGISAVRK